MEIVEKKIVKIMDKSSTKPEMTICARCGHFINRGSIWYDQYCGAPEVRRPQAVDPVTGKRGFSSRNDLGTPIYDDNPYPHARDINTGECPYFKKTGWRNRLK